MVKLFQQLTMVKPMASQIPMVKHVELRIDAHAIVICFSLGLYPSNLRSVSFALRQVPSLSWLAPWIPRFFKFPYWLWHQAGNKF